MVINRYNYEEYFLLYVDRELSAEEKKEVEAFAAEHPDLGEELQLLQQSVMKPEKHLVFTNKDTLMKSSLAAGLINESNYEEYFILYADDELSTPQKIAVEEYVYAHPERQHEFELFQQAKLEPEKIECGFKQVLYKKETQRKPFPLRWGMTAAAAAVLFIAGWFWLNQDPTSSGQRIADDKPAVHTENKTADVEKTGSTRQEDVSINTEEKNDNNPAKKTDEEVYQVKKATITKSEKPALAVTKKLPDPLKEPKPAPQIAGIEKDATPLIKPLQAEVDMQRPVDVAKAQVKEPVKDLAIVTAIVPQNTEENDDNIITFADNRSENVFLTNIPVDNNVPLRSFLRKASRVINKVTALKHSNRSGVSIGNVEIAIQ